jgi:serine kinase of HPr protein (carbohydrate metabolism regulator)
MLVHASTVAIDKSAVLITGPAGIGKSDLALRLIDDGAELVADDQTFLAQEGELLIASAPASIAGLMEVRHIGLLHLPYTLSAIVALYVELTPSAEELERLPEKQFITFAEIKIRHLKLPAFAASTPTKIRAVLKYAEAE